jgi:hypothetical protein
MADSDPVPDTAMDTGSEASEPFVQNDGPPLSDEERAILDRLRDGGGAPLPGDVAEESPEAAAAADDDAPLTSWNPSPAPVDPLDPVFREPEP